MTVDKLDNHQEKFCSNPYCRFHVNVPMGQRRYHYLHLEPKVNPVYGIGEERHVDRIQFVNPNLNQSIWFCYNCANVVSILQNKGMIQ